MLITELINDSLVEIGMLTPQDEASPSDSSYALRTLNRIIDLYNTQQLVSSYLKEKVYELPESGSWTSPIEIGPGLQFDGIAPTEIADVFFRQYETDYPVKMFTHNQWSSVGFKNVSAIPYRYYAQRMDENALKISFDCIPLNTLELHLMCKMPINEGAAFKATDDITFGYGVEKMLLTRLALELCPSYEIEPSQILLTKAGEAENAVKAFNYNPTLLGIHPTLKKGGRFRDSRTNRARY